MKVDTKDLNKAPHASDFPKSTPAEKVNADVNAEGGVANNLKAAERPARKLHVLIEEVLTKGIEVELTVEGYKVAGFYGMSWLPLQDSQQPGVLVATDHKGKKHAVKDFNDLIALNNLVWKGFYKQEDKYRRPDIRWFTHLYESGQMELVPGKTKD